MKNKVFIGAALMVAVAIAWSTYAKNNSSGFDYAWLSGHWKGDGFGGVSESIWSPPAEDGTMVGVFRHFNAEGKADFYQFLLLDKTGMHIKHFNSELVGWEKKEDHVTFKMMSFDKNRIELEGLVYERKSDDEMSVELKMNKNGKIETEVFSKKRVRP